MGSEPALYCAGCGSQLGVALQRVKLVLQRRALATVGNRFDGASRRTLKTKNKGSVCVDDAPMASPAGTLSLAIRLHEGARGPRPPFARALKSTDVYAPTPFQ